MRITRATSDLGSAERRGQRDPMDLVFEWDEEKAGRNEAKHGVTFEEARTVFNDPFAMTVSDPAHSELEDRWLEVGLSHKGRLLVVWYTERRECVRIIGCREATRVERKGYEHGQTA